MRKSAYILLLLLGCAAAFAADKPLLPERFSGWTKSDTVVVTDAGSADAPNAGLLKEFRFQRMERAVYLREGRKLTVKAAEFADGTGAYGAFVYYKQPQMHTIRIGDQGASANEHVIFYRGNLLIDAVFEKLTAMSAAEMRDLAQDLEVMRGPAASPPILPSYLPKQSYVRNSARFVAGPVGLEKTEAPLSAEVVDFGRGAEVTLGKYETSQGSATMVIIAYPTPQIAADRERAIQALHAGDGTAWFTRRSGPLVALITGPISEREATSLLESVNYDADVTWAERTGLEPSENVGSFILAAFGLVAVLAGFMFVIGIAFGGVRLVLKRLFPDRVFDRPAEIEIIRLNLEGRRGSSEPQGNGAS